LEFSGFLGKVFPSSRKAKPEVHYEPAWQHLYDVCHESCSNGNGTITRTAGNIATQPPGSAVDLTGVTAPGCTLTQDVLDNDAVVLTELGANDPDTNGWLTMGPSGPIYPLYIGMEASSQLLLNNAELRDDYRFAFEGKEEANLVIQRLGASRIIKNWRHIINLFPPRWSITDGTG